jgi:hypothetical protein
VAVNALFSSKPPRELGVALDEEKLKEALQKIAPKVSEDNGSDDGQSAG